jgi:hypothetical protein
MLHDSNYSLSKKRDLDEQYIQMVNGKISTDIAV